MGESVARKTSPPHLLVHGTTLLERAATGEVDTPDHGRLLLSACCPALFSLGGFIRRFFHRGVAGAPGEFVGPYGGSSVFLLRGVDDPTQQHGRPGVPLDVDRVVG